MKIGKASNSAKPGESVNVEVDGQSHEAIAGNEINSSKVLIIKSPDGTKKAFSESSTRQTYGSAKIQRKRPKKNKKTTYPIKIMFTVDNEQTDKTEFWLGGDRKNPVKIHELPISNNIDIQKVILSNLGEKEKDWVAFIKWFDTSLTVNFKGVRAFDGSTVISFLKPNETATHGISGGLGDKPYQQNMEYRGNDLANINPRFFASISNLPLVNFLSFLNTTTRVLHDPLTRNLEFISPVTNGEIYTGWTELDLYVLSGLENNPVRLFDMIPRLQDNLLSSDYDFSVTHDNVRQYFNPFSNNTNFQETIAQGQLTNFALTKYKGFLKGENASSRFDPYAFFLSAKALNYLAPNFAFNYSEIGYVYETYQDVRGSLYKFIDKVFSSLDHTNNGASYPRHLIETKVYTANDKPNDYYLQLGLTYNNLQWHSFFLGIDHRSPYDYDYDNSYFLETYSFDNTTIPLAEVQFHNYSLNNLTFSGSYSRLVGTHFRFYTLWESTPDNNFFRYLDFKKISGSASISSIEQQANIDYLEYRDQGAATPLTNNKWGIYSDLQTRYKINIPYVYFKGKTSKIVATFKVDLKISTSQPVTMYEETYKFYWKKTEIELTGLGKLKKLLNIAGNFMDVLDVIHWYDTLVDNFIYRVIEDDNLDKLATKDAKLSVIKYKINDDGTITELSTKSYSALSLKNANSSLWSANFYPQRI